MREAPRRWPFGPLLVLVMLAISGCAAQPAKSSPDDGGGLTDPGFYDGMEESFAPLPGQRSFFETYDPWGPLNRRLYVFNAYLDDYVLLPAVRVYRFVLPGPVRQGITNFFDNLNEVTTFVNLLLQFKGGKAATTAARFATNTTVGVLGLLDVASRMEIPKYDEDLGQTLGFYGVGPGPYLVLPLFGPSSVRDTAGLAGDFWIRWELNVFGVRQAIWASVPLTVLEIVQIRDNLAFSYGDLSTPFEYEMVRYFYLESREFRVLE